jgi:hypothetical protein
MQKMEGIRALSAGAGYFVSPLLPSFTLKNCGPRFKSRKRFDLKKTGGRCLTKIPLYGDATPVYRL